LFGILSPRGSRRWLPDVFIEDHDDRECRDQVEYIDGSGLSVRLQGYAGKPICTEPSGSREALNV
jgi:hypothetical protein